MPRTKSPYARVNERRRKREWNTRSTGQLNRRRTERLADLEAVYSGAEPRRKRHGLVRTGYLAALVGNDAASRADALRMVEEERAQVAAARAADAARESGLVAVRESRRASDYVRHAPNTPS